MRTLSRPLAGPRATSRTLAGTALAGLLVVLATAGAAAAAGPTPTTEPALEPAAVSTEFAIGAANIAKPGNGGRTMWVSTQGSDKHTYRTEWGGTKTVSRHLCLHRRDTDRATCPPADAKHPLHTIQAAILSALPGDVIVVRGGTYTEAVGWNATSGTAKKRIVLQSEPGARVVLRGTLMMKKVSYWTVRGFHFLHDAGVQGNGQAIVHMQGGTGWVLTNNEIAGSPGVSNLMVTPGERTGSTAARKAAGPHSYAIVRNCIRDNRGRHDHGMDHNIYLMAGVYSSGGRIERNLLAGAPNGAQIKVSASTWDTWADSPRNVRVRYNTMINGAAGVTVGVAARNILIERNIVANQVNGSRYDAAIKTWELERHDLTTVKSNYLAGYAQLYHQEPGEYLVKSGNVSAGRLSYVGSITGCTAKAANAHVRETYGQRADL
ncbi:hypothetical protein KIN34_14540 [Cellulomonas sp. DKR-3]|uniref:DUF1565 domain-containing protein n=1 Tax=Cellulomonas fulva TaxID=2835530 RepID=A0ABS5U2F9_9CELL|nr:hypothetical protein [Cellulomonas fulva]MBT0995501.1 hypothetical protein [Cellulomonas fulva]